MGFRSIFNQFFNASVASLISRSIISRYIIHTSILFPLPRLLNFINPHHIAYHLITSFLISSHHSSSHHIASYLPAHLGHAQHYKDSMFTFDVEGQEWGMKPMNCPGHCLMFGHRSVQSVSVSINVSVSQLVSQSVGRSVSRSVHQSI